MPFSVLNAKQLHHAYCISGNRSAIVSAFVSFVENVLGVTTKGNPDYSFEEFNSFGIDDARLIRERQLNKAFGGGKKIFCIALNAITREAQNSLLKIFEEPTEGTHFFLVVPRVSILLPTLRSRIIILENKNNYTHEGIGKGFLSATVPERLKMVTKWTTEIKDGKKVKEDAIMILNEIETVLHGSLAESKSKNETASALSELVMCASYARDTSASIKMIFEHLALILPNIRS